MSIRLLLMFGLTGLAFLPPGDFISEQKRYPRVAKAFKEKSKLLDSVLTSIKIEKNKLNILVVAYKHEKQLELYGKNAGELNFRKVLTYKICSSSGALGPKRMKGDGQVPEGFYYIDRFNPSSSYYLSLGLNYPNDSDKKKTSASDPGGDIFIHGECVTIGCMPMTNDKIQEIYLLAIQAKQNGQSKIPVYVFPFRMTDDNTNLFCARCQAPSEIPAFWKNIKGGYDRFVQSNRELKVSVNSGGDYVFN